MKKRLMGLWVFVLSTAILFGADVKMGILGREAAKYNVDFRGFSRLYPAYKKAGLDASMIDFKLIKDTRKSIADRVKALKQYNVIVLSNPPESYHKLNDRLRKQADQEGQVLAEYVKQGGGLVVFPQGVRYPGDEDEIYWNIVYKHLGMQFLHEGVYDTTREFEGMALHKAYYFRTQNIKKHPVTEGVKRLYLPKHHYGHWPGVPAMKYTKDWKIVVRGEKEAKSYGEKDNILTLTMKGTYDSEPPVIAYRNLGKGRIVSIPVANIHTGMNYGNPLWPGVFEENGDKGSELPSQGMKLMTNAMRWAGEANLKDSSFGTIKLQGYQRVKYPPKVSYKTNYKPPRPPPNQIKALFGAISKYGGGKGTVAQYAEAAKQAGVSVIVFADPLEKLTKETLEKLKKDCEKVSDSSFLAVPGITFNDLNDIRWAFWGNQLVYPDKTTKIRSKEYTLWDGKRIHLYGQYSNLCGILSGAALISYKDFRKKGCHPENMWWFFHYFPFVYKKDKLVEDNFQEYLHGLSDLRWSAGAAFSEIDDPKDLAAAVNACTTRFNNVAGAKSCLLGARCAALWRQAGAQQYVTQGPQVDFFTVSNSQMETNWDKTRGGQRVAGAFSVRSDDGIKEVIIHDADRAILRRFKGNGAKSLFRTFEIVHDRQHPIIMEVIDEKGKRAISHNLFVYCYKQGLFRCGDNLNILGATAMCWHPDRNQMFNLAKDFENGKEYAIMGWDTSSLLFPKPSVYSIDYIMTKEYGNYPQNREKDGVVGKVMETKLVGHNLQIATMHMKNASQGYDTKDRPGPVLCSVPKDIGKLKFFERTHTMYAPKTKSDYFTIWNYRRYWEGMEGYRGAMMWHEGEIKFTKDVTLRGNVPIPLFDMRVKTDLEKDWATVGIVDDVEKGLRVTHLVDLKKGFSYHGTLAPGGYASIVPTLAGYIGFYAPPESNFSYQFNHPWGRGSTTSRIAIGLGKNGQKVKAGTVMKYRFGIGTIATDKSGNEMLLDVRDGMNLDGSKDGYPVKMQIGSMGDATFFFTANAKDNEAKFTLGPRRLLIDLPIKVKGLDDSGCAAIYSTVHPWFRFVPIQPDGTAYFQESIDRKNEMWVGNPLVCDNKEVKITLVIDGLPDGKKPFVELHNPTDNDLTVTVTSPNNTPLIGGAKLSGIKIPAGDSIKLGLNIKQKKLTQLKD